MAVVVVPLSTWTRIIDGKNYTIMGRFGYEEEPTGLTILRLGASIWREKTCIGIFQNSTFAFFAEHWTKEETQNGQEVG